MFFKFDPLKTEYKNVGGERAGELFKINVRSDANDVWLSICLDGQHEKFIQMQCLSFGGSGDGREGENGERSFGAELKLENGLYFYYFVADGVPFYANELLLAERGDFYSNLNKWQLTVYPADYVVSEGLKGGIIYQIFPDRFCRAGDFSVGAGKVKREDWGGEPTFRSADGKVRNNEFFGGNFKGIISKLPYLKSLGITAIYLNPIFESYSSHRYDTGDYMHVDEILGGDEAFADFLRECESLGVKVIIDGVFNHVGAGSVYFNKYGDYPSCGAYNSPNSPYRDWFTFRSYPENYECWWDFKTLPCINKNCESFQNFIAGENGVLEKYLSAGVYGVRLDVADELTDEFIKKIRARVKAHGDGAVIGEVWEDATNKIAYGVRRAYFYGGELDSVMNYPLKNAIIDYAKTKNCALLHKTVREQINNYPPAALNSLMNVLSTHDSVRLINALGRSNPISSKDEMAYNYLTDEQYSRGKNLLFICYALCYFLYGVPSLYYGDEAGLQGDLDPYNRRCYNWESADNGLIDGFLRLGNIRKNAPALKNGQCEVLAADKGFFAFKRFDESGETFFACNMNSYTLQIELSEEMKNEFDGKTQSSFELKPETFAVLTRRF